MKSKNKFNTLFIIFITGSLLVFSGVSDFKAENFPILIDPTAEQNVYIPKIAIEPPRAINPIHMVVIFSKFKGEAPGISLAPDWAEDIFDGRPGSVSHYFDEISLGQIKVTGEHLPKIYEMPMTSAYYVNKLQTYVTDLLRLVDRDKSVNYADFDNNGPDGIPGSDDDDGYVDYIMLMPISRPDDFIWKNADGIAGLNLYETYYTRDRNSKGQFIRLDKYSGSIAVAPNKNQAIGSICHEYIHYFGAKDLYDLKYVDNETDSAGIGYWGIMGKGTLGWNGLDGPAAPCAYTRMLLGCIGINNSNLIDIYGVHRDIRISDTGLQNGIVYRIWIDYGEYFLIEHRRNDGIYYDRHIPQNGILIWHILERATSNNTEQIKLCDLECADGRYSDAGYPIGKTVDTEEGGDNLDFWSHTEWYTSKHKGNFGDATDVYDGIRYTRFSNNTNPNSNSKLDKEPTDVEVFNIHPEGNEMVFDVNTAPFTDWSKEKYPLIGTAFHRFNNIFESPNSPASKGNTLYLINYGQSRNTDELITVYNDSLTVDNLSSLNYYEAQNAIVKRVFTGDLNQHNSKIIRENISINTFQNDLMDLGITPSDFGSVTTPTWIQKISLIIEDQSIPEVIELSQNYPNPFNSQTNITYNLSTGVPVTLEVFNMLGQRVITINRGFEDAGSHTIQLNAEGLSSGIYFYRVSGKTFSQTRKFLLIR